MTSHRASARSGQGLSLPLQLRLPHAEQDVYRQLVEPFVLQAFRRHRRAVEAVTVQRLRAGFGKLAYTGRAIAKLVQLGEQRLDLYIIVPARRLVFEDQ